MFKRKLDAGDIFFGSLITVCVICLVILLVASYQRETARQVLPENEWCDEFYSTTTIGRTPVKCLKYFE